MPREGAKGCQEVEAAGPGPTRNPRRQLQAGSDKRPHLIPWSRRHSPDSDHRVQRRESDTEGQVACHIQVNPQGLGLGRESEWKRAGWGGKGVPSLQAMASFPNSTQTAAGTGQGLLLKHWWLQALMISDA